MALARPHIRMTVFRIESVAVALLLRPKHRFLQLVHVQRVVGLRGDDLLLKQEAGVDIDHRLRLLGQAGIQQRQLSSGVAVLRSWEMSSVSLKVEAVSASGIGVSVIMIGL